MSKLWILIALLAMMPSFAQVVDIRPDAQKATTSTPPVPPVADPVPTQLPAPIPEPEPAPEPRPAPVPEPAPAPTTPATAVTPSAGTTTSGSKPVIKKSLLNSNMVNLNFEDVEIDALVRTFGKALGMNFLLDDKVKGKVTLVSSQPVPRSSLYNILQEILRSKGLVAVPGSQFTRIVPDSEGKAYAQADGAKDANGGVVARVLTLNGEAAATVATLLKPMGSPNNIVTPLASSNQILVVDYAENVQRMEKLLNALDKPQIPSSIVLKYMSAYDALDLVQKLIVPRLAQQTVQAPFLLVDGTRNALLVNSGAQSTINQIRNFLATLDVPTYSRYNVNVIALHYASAERVAKLLQGIITSKEGSGSDAATPTTRPAAAAAAAAQQPSSGPTNLAAVGTAQASTTGSDIQSIGFIQSDPSTNSLIVSASQEVYRQIRSVVDKLDVPLRQVSIEVLIVELSADRSQELGVQWAIANNNINSTGSVIAAGNFPSSTNPGILSVAQNLSTVGNGLNLGYVRGTLNIPGVGPIANLAALGRFLDSRSDAHVLSSPNLMVVNNTESKLIVGQNVPFVTGQYTQTGSSNVTNPFQTIERKDVGISLKVKPRIMEGGNLLLDIYQEVSSVLSTTNSAGLITNKRSIESSVMMQDGQVMVLGGLISDNEIITQDGIPFLSRIPILGALFRYNMTKRSKTNLMIFIRPKVIENMNDQAVETASRSFDQIDTLRADTESANNILNHLGKEWKLPDTIPYKPLFPAPESPASSLQSIEESSPPPKALRLNSQTTPPSLIPEH